MHCDILEEEEAYRGFFSLRRYRLSHSLFEGGHSKVLSRELMIRPDAVGVLPYDPGQDKIVLVEQFRVGMLPSGRKPWMLELVAGLIEPNETPETVAQRESKEEADAELLELEPIHQYFSSPGGSCEFFHLFCGRINSQGLGGVHGLAEEGEDIKVHVFPADEVLALMGSGEIVNAHTLVALQWFALNRTELRAKWA